MKFPVKTVVENFSSQSANRTLQVHQSARLMMQLCARYRELVAEVTDCLVKIFF